MERQSTVLTKAIIKTTIQTSDLKHSTDGEDNSNNNYSHIKIPLETLLKL